MTLEELEKDLADLKRLRVEMGRIFKEQEEKFTRMIKSGIITAEILRNGIGRPCFDCDGEGTVLGFCSQNPIERCGSCKGTGRAT